MSEHREEVQLLANEQPCAEKDFQNLRMNQLQHYSCIDLDITMAVLLVLP
jgi:hypothetical protein